MKNPKTAILIMLLFAFCINFAFNALEKKDKTPLWLHHLCENSYGKNNFTFCISSSCVKELSCSEVETLVSEYPDSAFKSYGGSNDTAVIEYDGYIKGYVNEFLDILFKTVLFNLTFSVPYVFFLFSVNKLLLLLPKHATIKRPWLISLILLPDLVSIVIKFWMFVLVIPKALKSVAPDNQTLLKHCKTIGRVGLAATALNGVAFLAYFGAHYEWQGITVIASGSASGLWVEYWLQIIKIRRTLQAETWIQHAQIGDIKMVFPF